MSLMSDDSTWLHENNIREREKKKADSELVAVQILYSAPCSIMSSNHGFGANDFQLSNSRMLELALKH